MIGILGSTAAENARSFSIRSPQHFRFAAQTLRFATTTTSTASSSLSKAPALAIKDGKLLLYRGPSALSNWVYLLSGGIFAGVGMTLGYNIYNHMVWPLSFRDPENQPKLVDVKYRSVLAGMVAFVGFGTAFIFCSVPTKTVTKLTLLPSTRQLIVRTSCREFSALIPRALYPSPLRKTAEMDGYYQTKFINERIIPLSATYRVRGSATAAALIMARVRSNSTKKNISLEGRECLEFRVGGDRFWYRLEAAGGGKPSNARGYSGFWARYAYRLRGKTQWEGEQAREGSDGRQLGEKEPWFADRRTFDDVIPLVKRK